MWRALVLGALNIGAFFFLLVAAYKLPGGVAALISQYRRPRLSGRGPVG